MVIKKFNPQNDRVLVKPLDQGDQRRGSILIADLGEDRPKIGTVVAVGPGRTSEFGSFIAVNVKVGDVVLVPKIGFMRINVDGEDYWTGPDKEIIATVELEDEN